MKTVRFLVTGAATAALSGTAVAQIPQFGPQLPPGGFGPAPPVNTFAPGGAVPPPPNALGIAPAPSTPFGENTIFSRLGLSREQREFRRRIACRTPGGQFIGRITSPLTALSGGLIRPFCPTTPSLAELLDPGAIGAAAKVKQDRAAAEERVKAIKYLGSVDCHYWPEAEDALIGALRGDRNEVVRYEAAVVLGQGCCCTPKVVVALSHAVSCSSADGFPSEKSARVRAAAAVALERCCTACCDPLGVAPLVTPDPVPVDDKDKDKDKGKKGTVIEGAQKPAKPGEPGYNSWYYHGVGKMSKEAAVELGRKALNIGQQIGYAITTDVNPTDYAAAGGPGGEKPTTLFDLFTKKEPTGIMAPRVPGGAVIPAAAVSAPIASAPAMTPYTPAAKPFPTPAAESVVAATAPKPMPMSAPPKPLVSTATPIPAAVLAAPKPVAMPPAPKPAPVAMPLAPVALPPAPKPVPVAAPVTSKPAPPTALSFMAPSAVPTPAKLAATPVPKPTPVTPPAKLTATTPAKPSKSATELSWTSPADQLVPLPAMSAPLPPILPPILPAARQPLKAVALPPVEPLLPVAAPVVVSAPVVPAVIVPAGSDGLPPVETITWTKVGGKAVPKPPAKPSALETWWNSTPSR